jgi:hypothetical protein
MLIATGANHCAGVEEGSWWLETNTEKVEALQQEGSSSFLVFLFGRDCVSSSEKSNSA